MTGMLKAMISASIVASTSYKSNTVLVLIHGNSSLIKDMNMTETHIQNSTFLENSIFEKALLSPNTGLKSCFNIAVAIQAPPKLGVK